jgi:hypothetical protein
MRARQPLESVIDTPEGLMMDKLVIPDRRKAMTLRGWKALVVALAGAALLVCTTVMVVGRVYQHRIVEQSDQLSNHPILVLYPSHK